MAKNKKKRTRTVSVRQDYRKGGAVKNIVDNIRKGLVVGGKTTKINEEDAKFGAVPKDESNPKGSIELTPTSPSVPSTPTPAGPSEKTEPPSPTDGEPTTPPVGGSFTGGSSTNPIINPEPEPDPGGETPAPTPTSAPSPAPTSAPSPEPTPAPGDETPEPTPFDAQTQIEAAATGQVAEGALIPKAEQAGFQRDAQGNLILDNAGNPIPLTPQVTTEMTAAPAVGVTKAAQLLDEEVAKAQASQVSPATQVSAAQMEAAKVKEDAEVSAAEGDVTKEIDEVSVNRVTPIEGAEVKIEKGALMAAAQGELSPEAKAEAAKNAGTSLARVTRAKKQLRNAGLSEEDITELGNDPEALEARLTDFSEEQRGIIEGLPEEALVSNQLDSLLSGMENGEIPMWARPAVTSVERMLAARGLSASTVGRDTLINAIIQSAIPLAQANAQAIQQSVAQQRGIEAQAAEADAQRQQQTALFNAGNVFKMDMANLSNEQQANLSNSRFLQTVSLTEANSRQQATIQNAVLMSQANLTEANLNQQAQINNAKNFLAMDMANLNNQQQAYMLEAQQEQQRILSNQASDNAAAQFNAVSENQINQFMANLNNQINQYNASQQTAVSQFNTTQENAATARNANRQADVEKFNAQLVNQVNQYNASLEFNRNQWNAQNAAAVEASNVQWRRQINTANTAVQNQINMQNAMNAFNLSSQSLAFLGQQLRDEADFTFRGIQSEEDRKAQIIATALANEGKAGEKYDDYLSALLSSVGNSYSRGIQTYGSNTGGIFGTGGNQTV